jgi:hypothetical protein
MLHPHLVRRLLLLLVALSVCPLIWAQSTGSPDDVFWLRTPLPLGTDSFILQPIGRPFFILSCVEDPRFNRLKVSRIRSSREVIDAYGGVWKDYPQKLTFRVTATTSGPGFLKTDVETVREMGDLNSFFLGLQFRLKVFQGLRMTVVDPSAIRLIGMPSDVPFDERVFRVSFDTKNFPVDARLVMEVLSPHGQTLSRFHLELL